MSGSAAHACGLCSRTFRPWAFSPRRGTLARTRGAGMLGPRHRQAGTHEGAGQRARRLISLCSQHSCFAWMCMGMIHMQDLVGTMAFSVGVSLRRVATMRHVRL